jgi:hypothetical protein
MYRKNSFDDCLKEILKESLRSYSVNVLRNFDTGKINPVSSSLNQT